MKEELKKVLLKDYPPTPNALRVYKKYAKKLIEEIERLELKDMQAGRPTSQLFPQVFCQALKAAIPEGFGLETYYTKDEILDWAYSLMERATYQKKDSKRAIRMEAASDVTIRAVNVFFKGENYDTLELEWDWCPLCWRPVLNSYGKKKCELHESGSKGYTKTNRLLKKINSTKPFNLGYDRIPFDKKNKIREWVSMAFELGFPDGWEFLSFTKNYLKTQDSKVDLSDIEACIEFLAPGTGDLFISDAVKAKITTDEFVDAKQLIKMNQKALVTRAETWLMLEASIERGGARENAGRPRKN